jgi:cation diffusion facilitator CzcD-associated flavoprotein CzcO
VRCAIVGSGLAALAAYATLRHAGVPPEEIAVFGTHADPTEVWRVRAGAIRQTHMRSESDGHLAAAAFPGLALRELTVRSLLGTVTNRYRPSVELFLAHAARVRERSGWDASFVERRVAQVRAVDGGLALDGEGPFAHVLLALGHPGLNLVPGTQHAYEPHDYAPQMAVIGAGMAAATEWRNALAAGSEVVSVRRREPLRRSLNVPRELFSKRGLASFHRLGADARLAVLQELSRPSYPPGREWDAQVRVVPEVPDGFQAIAATGFRKGFQEDPLLADLAGAHDLETHGLYLALAPDATLPALTDDRRTLSVAGVAGRWAFPASDTIAGAKYAARAFTRRVCRTR